VIERIVRDRARELFTAAKEELQQAAAAKAAAGRQTVAAERAATPGKGGSAPNGGEPAHCRRERRYRGRYREGAEEDIARTFQRPETEG